ncbi:MAG: hypothetical protein R6V01_01820 [Thermoplasmatota archaeon]
MFDKKDIENLGEEFQRGLEIYQGTFDKKQVTALRTAMELTMMNALKLVEDRAVMKGTQHGKE